MRHLHFPDQVAEHEEAEDLWAGGCYVRTGAVWEGRAASCGRMPVTQGYMEMGGETVLPNVVD